MPRRPRLYTMGISHYCVSVERMLAFKGIAFDRVYAPYHDRQELLRVTGQDYVPALVKEGKTVTWSEIPAYLDRIKPDPPLVPAEATGLALALENWGHQVVEERVWRAVVTEIPRVLKDPRERWVFEEMQTRARGPWHVLEARQREFLEELESYFGIVDRMVEGREWILDRPSIADFGIFGGLSPWLTVGRTIPSRYGHLAGWARRIAGM